MTCAKTTSATALGDTGQIAQAMSAEAVAAGNSFARIASQRAKRSTGPAPQRVSASGCT